MGDRFCLRFMVPLVQHAAPMRTVFSWIHLADLSDLGGPVGDGQTSTLIFDALVTDIKRLAGRIGVPKAIFITGNVGKKGRDYDRAGRFLENLTQAIVLSLQDVFVVPGTDDVDVGSDSVVSRQLVQSWRAGDGRDFEDALQDAQGREVLEQRFKRYLEFTERCGGGSNLYWSKRIEAEPRAIRLIGLNTALLFSGGEIKNLRVNREQLSMFDASADEFVIGLGQLPFHPNYIANAESARDAMASSCHVHLVSRLEVASTPRHAHDTNTIQTSAGYRPPWGMLGDYHYNIGAIVENSDGEPSVCIWPRRWSTTQRTFVQDVDVLPIDSNEVRFPMPRKGTTAAIHENGAPPTPKKWPSARYIPYIERVRLDNIGPLQSVDWKLQPEPGWNVMIGNNGAGKTTFLRLLSYALVGSSTHVHETGKDEADKILFDMPRLLRKDGSSSFQFLQHADPASPTANIPSLEVEYAEEKLHLSYAVRQDLRDMFHAGFGPFRRFTGGDESYEKEMLPFPRAFRHLSLFTERIAFTESVKWLKDLDYKALENASERPLLDAVKRFVNSGHLFPSGVRLEKITSNDITFLDGNGFFVRLEELSDGFRSVLSLSLELLRQMASHYDREALFDPVSGCVIAPGIVLIDEVDVHLHPTWQREIGVRLRKLFPKIQFIVTTHSALVCQGAADGHGSIFRLAEPGTDEEGKVLEGIELARILYGNVLDAYGTEAFGAPQRSEQGKAKLTRLAELNVKELQGPLSPDEVGEQDELRAIFATSRN